MTDCMYQIYQHGAHLPYYKEGDDDIDELAHVAAVTNAQKNVSHYSQPHFARRPTFPIVNTSTTLNSHIRIGNRTQVSTSGTFYILTCYQLIHMCYVLLIFSFGTSRINTPTSGLIY